MQTIRNSAGILLMSLCACWTSEPESTVESFKMRATVMDVVALQEFKGTATLTHFDPRFALTVKIEWVTPPLTNFPAGSLATFAIHSPTRLFGGASFRDCA